MQSPCVLRSLGERRESPGATLPKVALGTHSHAAGEGAGRYATRTLYGNADLTPKAVDAFEIN